MAARGVLNRHLPESSGSLAESGAHVTFKVGYDRSERESQMATGFSSIITQLEQQKVAIETALEALRDIEGVAAPASHANALSKRKRGMTPAGRRRVSEALKNRWAAKKAAAAQGTPAPAATPAPRKVRFTPEGRKRLAEAMRKRWAAKRTAAQARKAGRKAA